MTDEDRFHAALDANPHDHVCRLAFADWLDENAGLAPCPQCGGTGSHALDPYELANRYGVGTATRILDAAVCGVCSGSGRASDGRREMAAGHRALGRLGICAMLEKCGSVESPAYLGGKNTWTWWDGGQGVFAGLKNALPRPWFAAVYRTARYRDTYAIDSPDWVEYPTRREAEDAAARAFGNLPAAVQAAILAGVPA